MDLTVFDNESKDDRDADTVTAIAALEADLGLDVGFVNTLLKEDDWSFIVKTYALVEAAITQLLITVIDQPKIGDDIAVLPIRTKLALMTSFDMLDGREQACILALMGIRNKLAHNISHVRFNLKEHVESLPKDKQLNLAKAFHPYRDDVDLVEIDGKKIPFDDLLLALLQSLPKRAIHDTMVLLVSLVSRRRQTEAVLKAHNMTVRQFAERLMRPAVLAGLKEAIKPETNTEG